MLIAKNNSLDVSNNGNIITGNSGSRWGIASLSDTEFSSGKVTFSCKLDKGNCAVVGVGSKSSDFTGVYPLGLIENQRGVATTNLYSNPVADPSFVEGDIITTVIDFDAGTMCYKKNGVDISARFDDLKSLPKPLYVLCQVVRGSALSLCENPDPHHLAPQNLTLKPGDSQVTLSWTGVSGATDYNVKRSTTAGGPYTTIATKVTDTKYVDSTVTNGTTYYYVVTAVDSSGNESANSNEASATPMAPVQTGQALLRVTMIDSSEREYRVPTAEIDGFVNWYNSHRSTDTMSYTINDSVDGSKEYLSFDKIISFKVIPLTK